MSQLTTNPLISNDSSKDLASNDGLATVETNLAAMSPRAKLAKVREEWVRKEMKAREDQFTSYGNIKFVVDLYYIFILMLCIGYFVELGTLMVNLLNSHSILG
jgi:hypothetical protein